MGNTEIFELCETSSKKQCPDCNLHWEVGIVYCSCGRCLKTLAEYQKQLDKKNFDALSIPGDVIKKNLPPWCKNMELPNGNKCTTKATEMLQKAHQPQAWWLQNLFGKMAQWSQIPQVFARYWWTKEQNIQNDEHALEDHSYIAAREERTRNEKNWVLKLNKEGAPLPMDQRADFVEAKRELKRLHDEHVKETSEGNTPIHPMQRTRQRRNKQFEELEEYNYQVDPRTRWRSYPSKSQGNLSRHPTFSSSSTRWEQHDDWKSSKSWNFWRSSSSTEQWCRQIHMPHATFSHVQSLHRSHSTDDMCTLAQDELCAEKTSLHPRGALPHRLSLLPLLCCCRLLFHCENPRQDGTSTESHYSTG